MAIQTLNLSFTQQTIALTFPRHVTVSSIGGEGTGDVVGPASSTDNAVARFNLTTGKLIQSSAVTISDSGAVAGIASITFTDGTNTVTLGLATNPSTGQVELAIL